MAHGPRRGASPDRIGDALSPPCRGPRGRGQLWGRDGTHVGTCTPTSLCGGAGARGRVLGSRRPAAGGTGSPTAGTLRSGVGRTCHPGDNSTHAALSRGTRRPRSLRRPVRRAPRGVTGRRACFSNAGIRRSTSRGGNTGEERQCARAGRCPRHGACACARATHPEPRAPPHAAPHSGNSLRNLP